MARVKKLTGIGLNSRTITAKLFNSRGALVEFGYLVQQKVIVSDQLTVAKLFEQSGLESAFVWVDPYFEANYVMITAPPSELAVVSNMVWKIAERVR